jgi:hypothetical protein
MDSMECLWSSFDAHWCHLPFSTPRLIFMNAQNFPWIGDSRVDLV